VNPKDFEVSIEDDFFDDIESCLNELANLGEVIFLFHIIP